jgi:hypothetical protein
MTDKKSGGRAYDLRAVVAAHRAACEKRGSWRRLGDMEYDAIAGTVLRQQREGAVDAVKQIRAYADSLLAGTDGRDPGHRIVADLLEILVHTAGAQ